MTKRKALIWLPLLAALILGVAAFVLARRGGLGISGAEITLLYLVLLPVLVVISLVFALRRSLRITLYSYRNIALVGAILFASVLALVLLGLLVRLFGKEDINIDYVYQTILDFPHHFSYYAAFVIFAVSLLLGVSNVSLIRHEGFRPTNALSILVAGFYIGGTVLIYWLVDLLRDRIFLTHGLISDPLFVVLGSVLPLYLLLLLCYFECFLVGTAIMGWLAARQKPKYDKDYIIILGCSIDKRGGLLPLLKGRVNRAVRFAWEQEIASGKPLKYVPSGGQGSNEIMSEGSAMELYLKTHGAEADEVFPEKKSTTTWENMVFSKRIIDELQPGAKIAFATTNYHMLRSGILAHMAGIDAEGIAGDTKWYFWPNGFIREFFGILTLKVEGHMAAAVITALLCAAVGCLEYFGLLAV